MDFTEPFRQSTGLVEFSPGAHFVLNAVADTIIVRKADTLQVTRTWSISNSETMLTDKQQHTNTSKPSTSSASVAHPRPSADAITHVGWSCDSEYILAACVKRGFVNVYKMRDKDWLARIEAGTEGLVKAEWSPDGRHILCFSQWGLRITIWSLVTGSASHIQFPTHPDKGYAFRHDSRYFVLAERHKSKDTVGVYDFADSCKLVRHFSVPTSSLASLSLSPSGNHIAVWEGALEFKLCVLSMTGSLLATFTPDPDPYLGIRCVSWHPTGLFIAVAGYEDKIYMLDSFSWSPICILDIPSRIPAGVTIWKEPTNWLEATHGRGFISYERRQSPYTVPVTKADKSKAHPKSGLVELSWNITGRLLVARVETMPSALFIFSFPAPAEPFQPRLRTVLHQAKPITHVRWNPARAGSLALCCSGDGLYTWTDEWVSVGVSADPAQAPASTSTDGDDEMAECIGIPSKKFHLKDIKWTPDGKGLALLDRDTFCCAFEVED